MVSELIIQHDIYHLPTGDQQLVFSPLQRIAAAVNKTGLEYVRRALLDNDHKEECSLHQLVTDLSGTCIVPQIPIGPAQPPFLGLILTRGCNMICRYCDFAAGNNGCVMSEELVSQAIGSWAQCIHNVGGTRLDLHFFGGEPFTQPDLIEIAVHCARHMAWHYGMALHLEASTNGLLDKKMVGFVVDHFGTIVLSLDGEAEDHNLHRPLRGGVGSFSNVWKTAQVLADSPVELCIRVCISSANVERMPHIAQWLCESLHPHAITFEAMKANSCNGTTGLSSPPSLAFVRGFVAAWREAQRAKVDCIYAALCDKARISFCPVGQDVLIVAPDRSIRSCYLRRHNWEATGLDMQVGQVSAEGNLCINQAALERLRNIVAQRRRCIRCFCRWNCAGGCIVTETWPGHGLQYTDFCHRTRLIQACILLEQLGMAEHVDRLLSDQGAVFSLWEHEDDRLDKRCVT